MFRGILLPFTTLFDPSGNLNLDGLITNIQKWNETGIAGCVAPGSTGERVNLDEHEYLQVIETTRDIVSSEKVLIVGQIIREKFLRAAGAAGELCFFSLDTVTCFIDDPLPFSQARCLHAEEAVILAAFE